MKKLIALTLSAVMLISCIVFANADDGNELKFGADGKFTVLQVSDPQDDHYPAYDMVHFIKLAIEETDPDLVIFTGDIVEDSRVGDPGVDGEGSREGVTVEKLDGTIDYEKTLANVKAATAAVFEEVSKRNIPFAISQGNNDHKSGIKNEDWLKIYKEYDSCLVSDESEDSDGRIDFNLEIKSSDGNKTAFNLWLMDTKTSSVNEEQIAWYKAESAALKEANGGKAVPSLVFEHIPTCDIGNLFEECNMWDEGAMAKNGKFYRLNKEIAGGAYSFARTPGETSEQFKAWKECGDVLGAYFGHEHTEGFTGTYDGIELGMTYGCEFAKSGPYGFRLFTIYENDPENFDNVLYIYEGSVKSDNARFVPQLDMPYTVYENSAEMIVAYIGNFFKALWSLIVSIF